MKAKNVLYEKRDNIATITLNRPNKLNAIDVEMDMEFCKAVDHVEKDDDIKVVILKGAGKSFSVGGDLEGAYKYYEGTTRFKGGKGEPGKRRPSQRIRLIVDREIHGKPFQRALECWKPIIAQIHGHCLGLGLYLTTACDISMAAEDAIIGHPEQRLGFAGSTFMLLAEMQLIGYKRMREILLTGKTMSGKEAAGIGLINRAVPADKLEEEVLNLAKAICLMPRDAVVIGKAHTLLAFDTMGITAGLRQGEIIHTLCTNLRWEEDEFNFLQMREKLGAREAFHRMHERFRELGF